MPLPTLVPSPRRRWLEQAKQYTLQYLPPAVGQPVGHIHGSELGRLPFQPTPIRSDLTQLSTAPRSKPARSAEDTGLEAVHRAVQCPSRARPERPSSHLSRRLYHQHQLDPPELSSEAARLARAAREKLGLERSRGQPDGPPEHAERARTRWNPLEPAA